MAAVGRRDVMVALVGICAGALVRGSRGPGCFPELTALRRLGAIYLVAHPEERARAQLWQRLIADAGGTIPTRLRSAVARDWSCHQVAVVDGWLLARTEARLCAALHLEAGARA
jgi:hypothetical protein